jgi:5-methylcytosine-specific restriction endonuclease McrA
MPSVEEGAASRIAARKRASEPAPETYGEKAKRFYASWPWRKLRFKILAENAQRHGGTPVCELCAAPRGDGVVLHVDHIVALSRDWEKRLDPTNLQVLCGACNQGKTNGPARDFRPAEFLSRTNDHG